MANYTVRANNAKRLKNIEDFCNQMQFELPERKGNGYFVIKG